MTLCCDYCYWINLINCSNWEFFLINPLHVQFCLQVLYKTSFVKHIQYHTLFSIYGIKLENWWYWLRVKKGFFNFSLSVACSIQPSIFDQNQVSDTHFHINEEKCLANNYIIYIIFKGFEQCSLLRSQKQKVHLISEKNTVFL